MASHTGQDPWLVVGASGERERVESSPGKGKRFVETEDDQPMRSGHAWTANRHGRLRVGIIHRT